ncbi:MAG TPA: spore coat protein U domain-containing protein [Ramlibacter sp.]
MKKLSLIAAAFALAGASAFAATATDSFNVQINFTGTCSVKTAAKDFSFTYTAFGAAQSDVGSTVFECSRGLTPTFSLNDNGGTMTGGSGVALAGTLNGEGVISGVLYTITASPTRTQTGTAAAAGAGGTGGTIGTADEYTVDLTVDIPGLQAGSGTGPTTGTHTRVLTITY